MGRGKQNHLARQALWVILLLALTGFSAGLGVLGVVVYEVRFGDISELEKSTILAKIQEETSIFYLDERTRIGSIFEDSHRRYVPIDEIPAHMINAMIAAEDKNFYHHFGIDPVAIIKAFGEGIAAGGKFRRGGSTITQQTVKNIMGDWEASFARKFREMIKSFQLETIYDKRQILEFYMNQFHVAGNGNGIGIAARYYFNKEVQDLDLVEAAFISGSVKGPSKYNPFIKFTAKTRERAKTNAQIRKNYVLKRMREQRWISEKEYKEAVAAEIPFNRGEFRTAEVALVELIRRQLKKKEILQALNLEHPRDLKIAGLRVYTTIDADLQNQAQLVMRRNLSRLETILQGFAVEDPEKYNPQRYLDVGKFYFGKVEAIEQKDDDEFQVKINFGLPWGTVPYESLVRRAKLLDIPEGKGYKFHLKNIRKALRPGDVVFVEVLDFDIETQFAELELHRFPSISGGLIAIDKGEVRSVISGFDTVGFNRAMQAKRQPGSVFKSLVFFAALQLGWSVLDVINNERQIFVYQGRFYYPRPDHVSPYRNVSMLWAGVLSENLASVTLAARLVDKLNFNQFKKLMGELGLLPQEGERPRDYHYRVARTIGVQLENTGVRMYQLKNVIDDIGPDLVFSGKQKILRHAKGMWWGLGYNQELQAIFDQVKAEEEDKELPSYKKLPPKEIYTRMSLLKNNFKRLENLEKSLLEDWSKIIGMVELKGAESAFREPALQQVFSRFRVLPTQGTRPELGYFAQLVDEPQPDPDLAAKIKIFDRSQGRALNVLDAMAIWGSDSYFQNQAMNLENVKLDGHLDVELFRNVREGIEQKYRAVLANDDPYDLPRYYQHHDFRIGLSLYYLVKLAEACGVTTKLEPVLSFPLGTNVVSAATVAMIYQTFISGKVYKFFDEGPENQLTFIRRIEDRFGNTLYETKRQERQLVDPKVANSMREILRKVVTHGTGRRARGELHVDLSQLKNSQSKVKVRIPAFGKTGTTNDFTTAYFAGFIPYPVDPYKPLNPDNSYSIATYVGYDLNQVMRRGRTRVYGGVGALPVWTEFSKSIIELKNFGEKLDVFDLGVLSKKTWPLQKEPETLPLMIDLPRGLILRSGSNKDIEIYETTNLSITGESFVNEFALGPSVRSLVNLHPNRSLQGRGPIRLFSPVSLMEDDEGFRSETLKEKKEALPLVRNYDDKGNRIESPKQDVPINEWRPKSESPTEGRLSMPKTPAPKVQPKAQVPREEKEEAKKGYTEEDL